MNNKDNLRDRLIKYIQYKFRGRDDIVNYSQDIVNDTYLKLYETNGNSTDKENFGYMSVMATRIAFKYYKRVDVNNKNFSSLNSCLDYIGEDDFVDDILNHDQAKQVLDSLDILKKIERIIIVQRYYGDYKFSEIAKLNNLNLNTVLSHHRRSLEKLRKNLTKNIDYGKSSLENTCKGRDATTTKNWRL